MRKTPIGSVVRGRGEQGRLAVGALMAATLLLWACGGDVGASDPTGPAVANLAPNASILATPTEVPENDNHQTVVTLDGRDSSDPEGGALTYDWTVPSGRFVGNTSATDGRVQVTFPGRAPYPVTLTVRDPQGRTGLKTFTIGIKGMGGGGYGT